MKVTIYLLMFALLLQVLYKPVVLSVFHLARPYFAKTLCVQKETPKNCCQAQCVLEKTLSVDDILDKFLNLHKELDFACTDFVSLQFSERQCSLINDTPSLFFCQKNLSTGFFHTLLRPPIV